MSETKLIIFDLDGVLIESKDAHHEALNNALVECYQPTIMDEDRHKFEAIPTREKIARLGITDPDLAKKIRDLKAKFFTEDFVNYIGFDADLWATLDDLRHEGYLLAVASNAIRTTVFSVLSNLGIMNQMDFVISNQDVANAKPHPEMYWACMTALGVLPENTIIFEDSPVGLEGARKTGAKVIEVDGPKNLMSAVQNLVDGQKKNTSKPKRNIVIPMAGAGSRFKSAGFNLPKPLINVAGKPMIQLVLDNLKDVEGQRIFIVQKDHDEEFGLGEKLFELSPGSRVVYVDGLTKGAAKSVLAAEKWIDNDVPLLIVNSDQYIHNTLYWESILPLYFDSYDGGIITFYVNDADPRWSYVSREKAIGFEAFINKVAEKKAISDEATTGIYSFTKGSEFVRLAKKMIEKNITHNNEFYIAPVFNQGIEEGKRYVTYSVDSFNGLGDPVSVVNFLNRLIKENENVD